MANEREWIQAEISWWNIYCKTALLLGSLNDALHLLNMPINDKNRAEKALAQFLLKVEP